MSRRNRDWIDKLLKVWRSEPDSHQGQTALRTARKYMEKEGLSMEDFESSVVPISLGVELWEKALLELVAASRGISCSWSGASASVEATRNDAASLQRELDGVRRAILLESGNFARQFKMTIDASSVSLPTSAFCNFCVLGIGEILLEENRVGEAPLPNYDALISNPGDGVYEFLQQPPSGYRGARTASRPPVRLLPGARGLEAARKIYAGSLARSA